jgi:hypothetical protein
MSNDNARVEIPIDDETNNVFGELTLFYASYV